MSIIINKSTNDKVVVTKKEQETIKVSAGIKGDTGPQGETGPIGPTGNPGVYVGATPPTDTSLLWVDTSSSITGGGGQSIYGLVDAYSYQGFPRVLIERTDNTTGWVVVNRGGGVAPSVTGAPAVDSSFGIGNEAVTGSMNTGPVTNATLNSKFYKNFPSGINVGNHGVITFEAMTRFFYHVGAAPPFEVFAATGENGTGTVYTFPIPTVVGMYWFNAIVEVPVNSVIKSIGVRSTIEPSGYSSDTYQFWIRDITLERSSNVQSAQLAGKTPVVTEATSEGAKGLANPLAHAPKLDLRRNSAVLPGLGGWYDAREWNLPEDGTTDVAPLIQTIIDSIPAGSSLRFPANKAFLVKSQITIKKPLRVDFNNCILYDNERRGDVVGRPGNDFISITPGPVSGSLGKAVTDVTLSNGKIYGTWYDSYTAASAFASVSGAMVVSGTNVLLNSINDSAEYQPKELSGNPYVRWMAQHYEPTYGVCNRFDVSLSGDGVTTAKIEVITQDTPQDLAPTTLPVGGQIIATQTVTPSSSPTSYTIRCYPNNLDQRLYLRVTKLSGTAPVTIQSVTPWGLSTYLGAYEGYNGITVYDACRVLVENWRIENTGGEGIVSRSFDYNTGDVTFRNIVCRCNHTQNYALTAGRNFRLEQCRSEASARTGFDFEPYATRWNIDHLTLVNCESKNDRNYSISCANWGLISNLIIDNFKASYWGFGAMIGGSKGGRISGFTSVQNPYGYTTPFGYGYDNSTSARDLQLTGKDMVITGVSVSNGLALYDATWTLDDTYTAGGNIVIGFTCNAPITAQADNAGLLIKDGSTVLGGTLPTTSFPEDPNIYSSAARIVGRPTLLGLDLGRWRKVFPNTFKGAAVDGMWWPYGINGSEGMVSTEGISSTNVKAKNLRGIGVPVLTGLSSSSVSFPSRPGSANFTTANSQMQAASFGGTTPVTLVPTQTYYYAICAILDWDDNGHRPAIKTGSVTPSTATPVTLFSVRNTMDWTNGTIIAGFAIYRGTTGNASIGPWDTRFRVRPVNPWFSTANVLGVPLYDTGGYICGAESYLSDRQYGYPNDNVPYGVQATAETGLWTNTEGPLQDTTGYEYDNNYTVVVTPSWVTTVAVTAKRVGGFDVAFGTPAPAGATFDWVLVR